MKSIGKYKDEDLYLQVASYSNNKRIYLGLTTEEENYADKKDEEIEEINNRIKELEKQIVKIIS